jgi:hypothetical protein
MRRSFVASKSSPSLEEPRRARRAGGVARDRDRARAEIDARERARSLGPHERFVARLVDHDGARPSVDGDAAQDATVGRLFDERVLAGTRDDRARRRRAHRDASRRKTSTLALRELELRRQIRIRVRRVELVDDAISGAATAERAAVIRGALRRRTDEVRRVDAPRVLRQRESIRGRQLEAQRSARERRVVRLTRRHEAGGEAHAARDVRLRVDDGELAVRRVRDERAIAFDENGARLERQVDAPSFRAIAREHDELVTPTARDVEIAAGARREADGLHARTREHGRRARLRIDRVDAIQRAERREDAPAREREVRRRAVERHIPELREIARAERTHARRIFVRDVRDAIFDEKRPRVPVGDGWRIWKRDDRGRTNMGRRPARGREREERNRVTHALSDKARAEGLGEIQNAHAATSGSMIVGSPR